MQESRATTRRTFGVEQQIARLDPGKWPTPDMFQTVRCADISSDGFAFFQATRPDFEELVIALGLAPDLAYLTARVVHTELIEMCGHLAFRVGCRFTGQLELCEATGSLMPTENRLPEFDFVGDCAWNEDSA